MPQSRIIYLLANFGVIKVTGKGARLEGLSSGDNVAPINNPGEGILGKPRNKNRRPALRVRTKNKIARGCEDAHLIEQAVVDAWEKLEDAIKELNDGER